MEPVLLAQLFQPLLCKSNLGLPKALTAGNLYSILGKRNAPEVSN